jgi:hypothetical protein
VPDLLDKSGQSIEVGLQNACSSAAQDCLIEQFRRIVHRQDDYFRLGEFRVYFAGRLKTVQFGHAEVENDELWPFRIGQHDRFVTRRGFATDFPAALLEHFADVASHDSMIISYHYTRHKILS